MIIKILFLHFLIFLTIASSSPSTPPLNFITSGTTIINKTSIILTQHRKNCISNTPVSNTGSVFYKYPIQFLDSSFNSTDSFVTRFTFTVVPPPPPCLSGEGITFLITSDLNSLAYSVGFTGSPKPIDQKPLDSSFLAVEFDSNSNHVGMNLDSNVSVSSVDLKLGGIDLKSGRQITAWIEYRHTQNAILIWVGYNQKMPESPTLVAVPVDLSKRLNGSMFVGFNGKGSSIHMIDSWHCKTSDFQSPIHTEAFWSENCLVCFPVDPVEDGEMELENNHLSLKRVLVLSVGLFFALFLIWVVLVPFMVRFYATRRNPRVREKRNRRRHRWMMMP